MNRPTLTGILCALSMTIAAAAVADSVTIKRTPSKNQTYTYAMSGSINVQGSTHDLSEKQVDTITDVAADGTYTTKSEQSDVTLDGQPAPMPGTSQVMVIKPTGELVSLTGDGSNGDAGRFAALTQFYYPTAAVNIGDSWTFEAKKDDKVGILGFKATMKYIGDEKVGAVDTFKVEQDTKETTGSTPATIHATVWLDKTDGSMVKAENTFSGLPISGFTIDGKMNFIRK